MVEKRMICKRFVCLPAHLHLNIIKWIDDCRYFVKTVTGLVFYLSICLHRLKVFLCREEAELGAGHVVRQSPAWGCRTGNKKHKSKKGLPVLTTRIVYFLCTTHLYK